MTNEYQRKSDRYLPTDIVIKKLSKSGCRPCVIVGHALSEIEADLLALNASVEEYDIAQEPELIEKYGITGVPALIFEKNGVEIKDARLNGLVAPQEIIDAVQYAKEVR